MTLIERLQDTLRSIRVLPGHSYCDCLRIEDAIVALAEQDRLLQEGQVLELVAERDRLKKQADQAEVQLFKGRAYLRRVLDSLDVLGRKPTSEQIRGIVTTAISELGSDVN